MCCNDDQQTRRPSSEGKSFSLWRQVFLFHAGLVYRECLSKLKFLFTWQCETRETDIESYNRRHWCITIGCLYNYYSTEITIFFSAIVVNMIIGCNNKTASLAFESKVQN